MASEVFRELSKEMGSRRGWNLRPTMQSATIAMTRMNASNDGGVWAFTAWVLRVPGDQEPL